MKDVTRRMFIKQAGLVSGFTLLGSSGCTTGQTNSPNQPSPTPTGLKIRPNVTSLNSNHPVLEAYRAAVLKMREWSAQNPNDPRGWTAQANIHQNFCPHGNWFFLPWHRAYLHFFEDICREASGNDDFVLPYWDWTGTPTIPDSFIGSNNSLTHPRNVTNGDQIPEEFTGAQVIQDILQIPDFEQFGSYEASAPRGGNGGAYGELEATPHNNVHGWIGRDMGSFMSPLDPIFWLHHANVDRLWALWNVQHANPTDASYLGFELEDNFCDRQGATQDVKIGALMSTYPLGYRYDNQPEEPSGIGVLRPVAYSAIPALSAAADNSTQLEMNKPLSIAVSASAALRERLQQYKAVAPTALPQTADRIRLYVDVSEPPADTDSFIRVFLNCPYLSSETPPTDIHHAGTFAFFGTGHSHGTHHPFRYVFEVTDTVSRLAQAGRLEEDIQAQFVAVSKEGGKEKEFTPDRVEISVVRPKVA